MNQLSIEDYIKTARYEGPHKYSRRCSVCGKFLEWVSEKNAKKEGVQDANSNRSADSTGSLGLS